MNGVGVAFQGDAPLTQVPFVVVDTETTGTKAGEDRLIEVAAVRVVEGEVVDRFAQLINPERSVPRRITQLTGISTGMVFDQPPAAEVLPAFLDFLGDGVFVAHNLSFDLRFLNAELDLADLREIDNAALCTLRLARRLLPNLRSKGLSGLAKHYGIQIDARHRAFGDAQATAKVLLHFFDKLDAEHGVTVLDDLLHFQNRSYRSIRQGPKHVERIRKEVLPTLPDRPGVYFMKDRRGAILYIGKAKSLRDRVRSYFSGLASQPNRTRKLVKTLRTVEWTETGSELGALLLESRLIKEHKPRFNRAQRRYRNRPFIRLDTTHDAPTVSWTAYVQDDGAEYFGPLGGRKQAELVVDVVNRLFQLRECDDDTYRLGRKCLYASFDRCAAPCVAEEADGAGMRRYATEVQRVRDFLTGQDTSVLTTLEARMQRAADAMKYEDAAEYRDWLKRLRRLLSRQRCVASPVLEHHAVLVQPATKQDAVQLYLVRFGRHAETITLPMPPTEQQRKHLRARLAHHFDAAHDRPERYFKQEVDEVRILAHWMYVHRDSMESVHWSPGMALDVLLDAVLERAREVA
ncbi:MAG: DEDD exonuclease domain-containing protein [Bacteroidetes bacterium]|jgi:DNA polymerase-3 subunit epsilon|nr:DEDD exonuclease domain-containing protein [Bacteroidota bacterium]